MELFWNGIDGAINKEGVHWKISTRPDLDFEFEDVYYAPKSRLTFKILDGVRQELVDDEVAKILKFVLTAQPEAKTLTMAIDEKLEELAAWRYAQETKGIIVNGETILTDRESQAALTAAYVGLKEGFKTTVDWKAANGQFVSVTLETITPIAQAVFSHVQQCFSAEKQMIEEVRALASIEAVKDYEFALGG